MEILGEKTHAEAKLPFILLIVEIQLHSDVQTLQWKTTDLLRDRADVLPELDVPRTDREILPEVIRELQFTLERNDLHHRHIVIQDT